MNVLDVPTGAIEIGTDHWVTLTWGAKTRWTDVWPAVEEGKTHSGKLVLVGLIEYHLDKEGHGCGGSVSFARPIHPSERETKYPLWTASSIEPLSIDPSVLCKTCGMHGRIHDGVWVSA